MARECRLLESTHETIPGNGDCFFVRSCDGLFFGSEF